MSSQTSLVTEAARTAAIQNTGDYAASVAAHIAGDLGKHNQVAVHDQAYPMLAKAARASYATHVITDAKCLRMLVTIGDTNYAVIMPGIAIGSYTGGGSDSGGAFATAPVFTLSPISAELIAGSAYTLTIAVTGTAPILLQWTKNGAVISGATSVSYTISNFQAADAGNYVCVATNSVGQTLSTTAVLSVRTTSTSEVPSRPGVEPGTGGGCFTRNTMITMATGVLQPISALRRGDKLRSYDLYGLNPDVEEAWRQFAQPTVQATPAEVIVKEVLMNSFGYYYKINDDLEVTYEHPLLAKRGTMWRFMMVQDLKTGDYLFKNGSAVLVRSIVRVETPVQTWNLNVEPFDLYLANGFVAHNVYYKF
ncbi:MAG: immunoglobulin domain-containing protein [Azonexus sp.]